MAFVSMRGSELSPFEDCEEPFLVMRTSGGVLSTMVDSDSFELEELCVFQMGYTNLWVLRRVGLYRPDENVLQHFPDPQGFKRKEQVGRYFVIGDKGTGVGGVHSEGLESRAAAEASLQKRQKSGESYLIARLVEIIYWH